MLAIDTNVLVYAHRRETAEHADASALMKRLAEGSEPWAIPWPCLYEFFSVVTNAKIWKSAASSSHAAWSQVDAWISSPSIRLLAEPVGFAGALAGFVKRRRVHGPVVHDARIAAICCAESTSS